MAFTINQSPRVWHIPCHLSIRQPIKLSFSDVSDRRIGFADCSSCQTYLVAFFMPTDSFICVGLQANFCDQRMRLGAGDLFVPSNTMLVVLP